MKRKLVCFVALILCLSLAVTAAVAEEGCGLGEAVSARWDEQAAAPQVSVRTEGGDVAVSGVQDVMAASGSGSSSADLVIRMYRQILGRDPDAAGLAAWTDALNAGRLTAADLVLGFVDSPEYKTSGRSSTQIVTDLYKAMMGREPDEAGLKAWKKYLDVGMTPRVLCAGFVGSPEEHVLRCAQVFARTLWQHLERSGLNRQTADLFGPAPAPIVKINNKYRYRLTLLCKNSRQLRQILSRLLQSFAKWKEAKSVTAFVDVNGYE